MCPFGQHGFNQSFTLFHTCYLSFLTFIIITVTISHYLLTVVTLYWPWSNCYDYFILQDDPKSNITGSNKSNVITVTVFGNFYEEKKYHSCTWRSVCPPVCPLDRPTDTSSHFCPKISVCHRQKSLTHGVFVMKINHCDSQPSRPRPKWTFPWKMASIPMSESDSVQFTDGDNVIM